MNLHKHKKRQQEIKEVLERYKQQILDIQNVVDIGVGFSLKNRKLTDELAIIIEVRKKEKEEELDGEALLPKSIEGIRVDVIGSPVPEDFYDRGEVIHPLIEKTSVSRNIKFANLIGGIRIRNSRHKNLGGTLGAVFYDKHTGKPFGISSRHVLVDDESFSFRRSFKVIQPNLVWRKEYEIGTVKTGIPSELDCVRFEIDSQRPVNKEDSVLGIKGRITGIEQEIVLGAKVMKSGARTGVTYGIIVCESICRKRFVIYPDDDYKLVDNELSLGGDSGAIWLLNDGSMRAVGLHILGNKSRHYDSELAVALNFETVMDYLSLVV